MIIDKMKENHEQFYYFEANEQSDASEEIELIYVQRPSKTTIEVDDKKFEGSDGRDKIKISEGDQTVICNAENGQEIRNQNVECTLWIGDEPFLDAKDFDCRNADRDDKCVEFEIEVIKDDHDGLDLYCQCLPEGILVSESSRDNPSLAKVKLEVDGSSNR